MTIRKIENNSIEIKSKQGRILLSEKIQINDFIILGNGEYELGGVEAERTEGIFNFRTEEINSSYLDKIKDPLSEKEKEFIDGVDILFLSFSGNETIDLKIVQTILSETEPKVVVFLNEVHWEKFLSSKLGEVEKLDLLKITKNDLEEEKQRVILLNVSK